MPLVEKHFFGWSTSTHDVYLISPLGFPDQNLRTEEQDKHDCIQTALKGFLVISMSIGWTGLGLWMHGAVAMRLRWGARRVSRTATFLALRGAKPHRLAFDKSRLSSVAF